MIRDPHSTKTSVETSIGKDSCEHDLERCACDLAEKYQAGRLPDLRQTGWTVAWKYMVKDLRTCCPGRSEIEYGIALNHAFNTK